MDETLTLSLKYGLGRSETEELLRRIRSIPGVRAAGLISPESSNEVVRSIAFATLGEEANAKVVAKKIGSLPGVVSSDVPPRRSMP